jgi:sugar lactone lactonase YvrE
MARQRGTPREVEKLSHEFVRVQQHMARFASFSDLTNPPHRTVYERNASRPPDEDDESADVRLLATSLSGHEVPATVVAGTGQWGQEMTPVTELGYPVGVYVDRDYILYVADSYNHRVIAFPPGVSSGTVMAGGNGPGDTHEQLYYPHRVAGDRKGNLYVADGGNHRIVRWKSGKQPLEDEATVANIFQGMNQTGRKGHVVVDKTNGNIEQKSLDHRFGIEAAAAYDTDMSIYVIDRLTRSVNQYDADTDYAKVSFSYTYETTKGFLPTAVFFVSDVLGRTTGVATHFLYVVDISNHQVVRFEKNEFTTDVDPVIVAPACTAGARVMSSSPRRRTPGLMTSGTCSSVTPSTVAFSSGCEV